VTADAVCRPGIAGPPGGARSSADPTPRPRSFDAGDLRTRRLVPRNTRAAVGRLIRIGPVAVVRDDGLVMVRICGGPSGHVVQPSGQRNIATSDQLHAVLMGAVKSSAKTIVLDLSRLEFMDSSAIHLITLATRIAAARRREFCLARGPVHIQRGCLTWLGSPIASCSSADLQADPREDHGAMASGSPALSRARAWVTRMRARLVAESKTAGSVPTLEDLCAPDTDGPPRTI
jgi:anti-anti-sigma factor